MCNCNQPQPCNNCNSQLPCGCSPSFTIVPAPVPCTCCPQGYTFTGATPNFPNGICTTLVAPFTTTATIPCVSCEDTIPTDCVVFQCTSTGITTLPTPACNPCGNVVNGDTLTTIIGKICPTNPANILAMLQVIAADTTYGLKQAFCDISNYCSGIPGSLTPYIGPITFSIP